MIDREAGFDVRGFEPQEYENGTSVTATERVTENSVTVAVETGVHELSRRMDGANGPWIPVVDGEGPLRTVTSDDIGVLLSSERDGVVEIVRAESSLY